MENEAKKKLDFLKRIGEETIKEKLNISYASKSPIFIYDSFMVLILVESEYVSKADIAEYFGIEESEVESFMFYAEDFVTYYKSFRNIYNEIKKRFDKEYGK